MDLNTAERTLIFTGALLVTVAMITGAVAGQFPTVRLLLSAHLAATMSGTLMVAVGAGLHKLTLGDAGRRWLVITLNGSGWLNLVGSIAGAVLGTNQLTPVHGSGGATMAAEAFVGGVLTVMAVCTFAGLGILARGAWAR